MKPARKIESDPLDTLKAVWGYESFRPLQREIICSVLEGRDTLAILPTGGGKSITFQLPALMLRGVTIVISPLIALMTDQVDGLRRKGVKCALLHAGMSHDMIFNVMEQAKFGAYDLIYVSPERLASEGFRDLLRRLDIALIAVDEAHCISQWGYDFRPPYLQIPELRRLLPHNIPVLALTASATRAVERDIVDNLRIELPGEPDEREPFRVFRQSVRRDNLTYVVRACDSRISAIDAILRAVPGTSIVYARTRATTEELADNLRRMGHKANFYHAGLERQERDARQQAWMKGETRILAATNAFGMGIDKADVRTVFHYDIPDSLEAYYQEAGRAGRDGRRAYAIMLYDEYTLAGLDRRPDTFFPTKEYVRSVYQALANYYIIGAGSGCESVFPLDRADFCTRCRLQFAAAANALRVLEWAGYITLIDAQMDASKLQVLLSPADAYDWQTHQLDYDPVLEAAMRQYPGIFTDLIHIDEDQIADDIGTDRNTVYRRLSYLAHQHIVNYVPFKRQPLIKFLTKRFDARNLPIPEHAYEKRKKQLVGRLKAVRQYITTTECRTACLARYFGEEDTRPCGRCDNCISKNKKQ